MIKCTIRHYYVHDALGTVFQRMAAFIFGLGLSHWVLTWAGYRNATLHGVWDGVLSIVVFFALALLTSGGYLVSRSK
jgi:hypothetical protein